MMTTGPMGSSSMAFCTGSVVVPFTSETRERALAGDGIDHAGLPSVAQTEEADVYPFARGAVIQSHRDTSFLRTGNRGGWTP